MKSYELDYNVEDISELITRVRVSHQNMSEEKFAEMLEIKPETLRQVEDCKGAHIMKVFQKCIELGLISEVKITLSASDMQPATTVK